MYEFDAQQVIDAGFMIQPQQANEVKTQFEGEITPFILAHLVDLKSQAFDIVTKRHCKAFDYENYSDVLQVFLKACSEEYPTIDNNLEVAQNENSWRVGDVARVELLEDVPTVKMESVAQRILNAALTEICRNIYRRLNKHRFPIAMHMFRTFQSSEVPLQCSADFLWRSMTGIDIEAEEMKELACERNNYWQGELVTISTAYISAMPSDPSAKVLQISGAYQRSKEFTTRVEEAEQPKEKEAVKFNAKRAKDRAKKG